MRKQKSPVAFGFGGYDKSRLQRALEKATNTRYIYGQKLCCLFRKVEQTGDF